ncbi:metallophosphoesterase [Azospirillum sp. YIM B02556]|uniref:Metallophosphoesterase n=1 Tax=Azospirillum endophyticum TaxID=2800326 RepID=A0ABS1FGV7_9PROT|nr:metallophosphoesterase [Azospirillum endophyticum]MBK1842677.1 metallophosphoesterase [Azospirillum endophyticum]
MPTGFRFAHLSDPHLPLPSGWPAGLRALAGKRSLGLLSWRRKRQAIHRPEILAALMADVAAHAPDHVAVTGDLTNIALPDEFEQARSWLAQAGPPNRVTVVPGNHDATVAVLWESGLGRWQPWMSGDAPAEGFPFVRVRGPVAFVGVSTAVPSPPLLAIGSVGARQAARLEAILAELDRRGLFRVVLMHHPPLRIGRSERKALTDRRRVQDVLARAGAELVLHGHHHRDHIASLPGPGNPIPLFGVASASAAPSGRADPARWIQFTVERRGDGAWRLSAQVRGYDAGGFRTEARYAMVCGHHDVAARP